MGIVKKILPENMGAIVRTAAENKTADVLEKDLQHLLDKWKEIQTVLRKTLKKIR